MKNIIIITLAFVIFACSENSTDTGEKLATKVDIATLQSYPGFVGFQENYDNYTPDVAIVDSITVNFNSANDNFYIYLSPDCRCKPSTETFPALLKTLDEAKVSRENIFIYVMGDETFSYPESDMIVVNDLPQLFIKHNENVFDITTFADTLNIEGVIFNSIK